MPVFEGGRSAGRRCLEVEPPDVRREVFGAVQRPESLQPVDQGRLGDQTFGRRAVHPGPGGQDRAQLVARATPAAPQVDQTPGRGVPAPVVTDLVEVDPGQSLAEPPVLALAVGAERAIEGIAPVLDLGVARQQQAAPSHCEEQHHAGVVQHVVESLHDLQDLAGRGVVQLLQKPGRPPEPARRRHEFAGRHQLVPAERGHQLRLDLRLLSQAEPVLDRLGGIAPHGRDLLEGRRAQDLDAHPGEDRCHVDDIPGLDPPGPLRRNPGIEHRQGPYVADPEPGQLAGAFGEHPAVELELVVDQHGVVGERVQEVQEAARVGPQVAAARVWT